MSRTLKDATVRRYRYECDDQFRRHLDNPISVYNFGQRLKIFRGLTG